MTRSVVVLDHGSGNVRSAVRMLEHVGARVELTADPDAVAACDGLYLPGVGNFHACLRGMEAAGAPDLVRARLARGGPVLGVCVGMQVLLEGSDEPSAQGPQPGLGLWRGGVSRLDAPVVPHMGWSQVQASPGTRLLAGLDGERFYFVHSYGAAAAPQTPEGSTRPAPRVAWATHGAPFVAAVEDGPLAATQFHPEKSGPAGAALLSAWLRTL